MPEATQYVCGDLLCASCPHCSDCDGSMNKDGPYGCTCGWEGEDGWEDDDEY